MHRRSIGRPDFIEPRSRLFTHLITPSLPRSTHRSAQFLPSSYTPELCRVPRNDPGPITPTLRSSQAICIMKRRPISPECLSARFSLVYPRLFNLHIFASVLNSFIRFIPGVLVVLFFKCIVALFNPVNRRRDGVKWGLVFYTVAMFSFATALTGMTLHIKSISYIDNREFPGIEGVLPPGSHGYQLFIRPRALSIIPGFLPLLNDWLADGLLVN